MRDDEPLVSAVVLVLVLADAVDGTVMYGILTSVDPITVREITSIICIQSECTDTARYKKMTST